MTHNRTTFASPSGTLELIGCPKLERTDIVIPFTNEEPPKFAIGKAWYVPRADGKCPLCGEAIEPLAELCRVHPAKSGAETLTIGFVLSPGETHAQRYEQWMLGRGAKCICPPEQREPITDGSGRAPVTP